jgi:NADH-quinone oxidoreductase subunit C
MDIPELLQPFALASQTRFGELTVEVAPGNLVEACRVLKHQLGFERVSAITAVDRYPISPRFEVVYHLHSVKSRQRIRIKTRVDEDAELDSVTSVWRGANWYEREVFDLFGVRFANHPDLRRIMMPDDWTGHPLRKDYPVEGYK